MQIKTLWYELQTWAISSLRLASSRSIFSCLSAPSSTSWSIRCFSRSSSFLSLALASSLSWISWFFSFLAASTDSCSSTRRFLLFSSLACVEKKELNNVFVPQSLRYLHILRKMRIRIQIQGFPITLKKWKFNIWYFSLFKFWFILREVIFTVSR